MPALPRGRPRDGPQPASKDAHRVMLGDWREKGFKPPLSVRSPAQSARLTRGTADHGVFGTLWHRTGAIRSRSRCRRHAQDRFGPPARAATRLGQPRRARPSRRRPDGRHLACPEVRPLMHWRHDPTCAICHQTRSAQRCLRATLQPTTGSYTCVRKPPAWRQSLICREML